MPGDRGGWGSERKTRGSSTCGGLLANGLQDRKEVKGFYFGKKRVEEGLS